MLSVKVEKWNDKEIRFIGKNGEWWAIAKDIADALEYSATNAMIKIVNDKNIVEINPQTIDTTGLLQLGVTNPNIKRMSLISEKGIYQAIFKSQKKEAEEFQDWVFDTIKLFREKAGLEQYQIFDMVADKNIQKELMDKIHNNVPDATSKHYMKANTIANKAVSNIFGYPKMIKKEEMSPEMLLKREEILNDTVELMVSVEKFGLNCSVSKKIYGMYC